MTSQRPIRRRAEHLRFQNAYVLVYDDDVEFPDGHLGTYLRVEAARPGRGVVIIAEHAGQFALVHSYRYPVQNWQWAFPRGFAQSASSAETAHAECVEELGSEPESLRLIGQLTPDSGLLSAVVDVFHAIVPAPTDKTADSIEIAAIRWVTLDQLEEMIAGNAIEDSFTLAALMLWHVDRGKT